MKYHSFQFLILKRLIICYLLVLYSIPCGQLKSILYVLFLLRLVLFYRFAWFYMQLNVVLLNSLIKAINHTYDILIIRVEFDMLLLAIRSVSFWGVLGLDLLHKRNRFFCFLV